jgi:hypothetical protein
MGGGPGKALPVHRDRLGAEALPIAVAEGRGRGSVSVHFGDSISDPIVRVSIRCGLPDHEDDITKKY